MATIKELIAVASRLPFRDVVTLLRIALVRLGRRGLMTLVDLGWLVEIEEEEEYDPHVGRAA